MAKQAVFPNFGTVNHQIIQWFDIQSITNANPCVVTTTAINIFTNLSYVRFSNLNGAIPGMSNGSTQLNNNRYQIIVLSPTTFSLQDPISHVPIDSTNFDPYIGGGYVTQIQQDFYYLGTNQLYPIF